MLNLSGEIKSGIKDLFWAMMNNLFGDEKIFSGDEKIFLGDENLFSGDTTCFPGMKSDDVFFLFRENLHFFGDEIIWRLF